MSKAADVTASSFEQDVIQSELPVLVDFWAEWCGPCRMIGPSIDAIADEYTGRLKVFKCNIDQESSVAAKFGIMSIPTLLLFKDGQVVEQIVGALPKQKIEEKISPHIQ